MEARALLYEAGISAGKTSAKAHLKLCNERGLAFMKKWYEAGLFAGSSSEKSTLKIVKEQNADILRKGSDYDTSYTWFQLDEMSLDLNGKRSIQITKSFIGAAYGVSSQPVCDFLVDLFIGVLEELVGNSLTGKEITRIAKVTRVARL